MTSKTVKYTLFALLPLLVVGLTSPSFAAPTESVGDALEALNPYVAINDKKIAKLDVSEAKKNGISNETIKIGKEYLKIQNKMIQDVHDNPTKKMSVSDEDSKKFKQFHDKVKNQGLNKTIKTTYLDFLLPLADAAGCNYDGPHSQPSTNYSGDYSSAQAGINDLPSGYNQVQGYAAAFTYDYHDWVQAYGCADGIFRYQTSIVGSGSDWEHRENHSPGEPNPEVLNYGWPVWWWAGYVYDWHN